MKVRRASVERSVRARQKPDPGLRVEPYKPGRCEFRAPNGDLCGKPAGTWVKMGDRPGVQVCDAHWFSLVPPRIGPKEGVI